MIQIQPEPIKPICYPGRRRIPSKITELSQVSKDFNALFKDIWCKQSTFVVASLGNPLKIIYPNPRLGHLIRNLQLILHLDTDHTSNYDMLYEGAYDGRFIFLTPSRNGNGQDTNATKWTQHFPHLDTLRICVVAHDVRGLNICGHGNSRKDNMMRALKGTKFAIEAKTTTVTASCACPRHIRLVYLEDMIRGIFENRSNENSAQHQVGIVKRRLPRSRTMFP